MEYSGKLYPDISHEEYEKIKQEIREIVYKVYGKFPLVAKSAFYTREEALEATARAVVKDFRGKAKVTTFAEATARNILSNYHKSLVSSKRKGSFQSDSLIPLQRKKSSSNPVLELQGKELASLILDGVNQLSEEKQIIYQLVFIYGLSDLDVAIRMRDLTNGRTEMKLSTVRSHIHRIRVHLRNWLKENGIDTEWTKGK